MPGSKRRNPRAPHERGRERGRRVPSACCSPAAASLALPVRYCAGAAPWAPAAEGRSPLDVTSQRALGCDVHAPRRLLGQQRLGGAHVGGARMETAAAGGRGPGLALCGALMAASGGSRFLAARYQEPRSVRAAGARRCPGTGGGGGGRRADAEHGSPSGSARARPGQGLSPPRGGLRGTRRGLPLRVCVAGWGACGATCPVFKPRPVQ